MLPIDEAVLYRASDMVELLVEAGASVGHLRWGKPPSWWAREVGDEALANRLEALAKEANVPDEDQFSDVRSRRVGDSAADCFWRDVVAMRVASAMNEALDVVQDQIQDSLKIEYGE